MITFASAMETLEIRKPTFHDAEDLLAFELANREYFGSWINARGDAYYTIDGVRSAIESAEADRQGGLSHQYLVTSGGQIVGRVNLTALVWPYFNKAGR